MVCTGYFMSLGDFSYDTSYEYVYKYCHRLMDELIHWLELYLLSSTTCDELLWWMIEIWMKIHLVSDSNCNIVNL